MLARQYRAGRHRWRGRVRASKVDVTRGDALIPFGADPPGKRRVVPDPGVLCRRLPQEREWKEI
eukprot:3781556-Prymnesium_polylepis.1